MATTLEAKEAETRARMRQGAMDVVGRLILFTDADVEDNPWEQPRIYGRIIKYGQEWYVLPKTVKETILSAAKDKLNVEKATGKGQMVTFLSNARKAEELNIKAELWHWRNDDLICHLVLLDHEKKLRAIRAEAPIWKLQYTDDTRSKWLHHNRPIISDAYQRDNMNDRMPHSPSAKACRQELAEIISKMATKEQREAARHKYRQFLAGKGWPTSLDVQAHWELSEEESGAGGGSKEAPQAAGGSKEAPKEPGAHKARSRSGSKSSAGKPSPAKKTKK